MAGAQANAAATINKVTSSEALRKGLRQQGGGFLYLITSDLHSELISPAPPLAQQLKIGVAGDPATGLLRRGNHIYGTLEC